MPSFLTSLRLDNRLAEPLYRQIYLRIKDAIAQGSLAAGSRLPSVRGLASDLGVARATVESAYAQLIAEGFLQSRGQAGTYVSPQLPHVPPGAVSAAPPLAAMAPDPLQPQGMLQPFQLGVPALDAFPRALWQRIVARQLRGSTVASWRCRRPAACLSCVRRSPIICICRAASAAGRSRFSSAPVIRRCWTGWWRRCCTPATRYGSKIPAIRSRARCCGPPASGRSPCRWMNKAWTWPPVG